MRLYQYNDLVGFYTSQAAGTFSQWTAKDVTSLAVFLSYSIGEFRTFSFLFASFDFWKCKSQTQIKQENITLRKCSEEREDNVREEQLMQGEKLKSKPAVKDLHCT